MTAAGRAAVAVLLLQGPAHAAEPVSRALDRQPVSYLPDDTLLPPHGAEVVQGAPPPEGAAWAVLEATHGLGAVALSPDGTRLAVLRDHPALLSTATGAVLQELREVGWCDLPRWSDDGRALTLRCASRTPHGGVIPIRDLEVVWTPDAGAHTVRPLPDRSRPTPASDLAAPEPGALPLPVARGAHALAPVAEAVPGAWLFTQPSMSVLVDLATGEPTWATGPRTRLLAHDGPHALVSGWPPDLVGVDFAQREAWRAEGEVVAASPTGAWLRTPDARLLHVDPHGRVDAAHALGPAVAGASFVRVAGRPSERPWVVAEGAWVTPEGLLLLDPEGRAHLLPWTGGTVEAGAVTAADVQAWRAATGAQTLDGRARREGGRLTVEVEHLSRAAWSMRHRLPPHHPGQPDRPDQTTTRVRVSWPEPRFQAAPEPTLDAPPGLALTWWADGWLLRRPDGSVAGHDPTGAVVLDGPTPGVRPAPLHRPALPWEAHAGTETCPATSEPPARRAAR